MRLVAWVIIAGSSIVFAWALLRGSMRRWWDGTAVLAVSPKSPHRGSWRDFNQAWGALAGAFYLSLFVFFVAFNVNPQSFYQRPYEYFMELVLRQAPLFLGPSREWVGQEVGFFGMSFVSLHQTPIQSQVSVDASGFRRADPRTPFVVVVIGDSQAWGSGVSDSETFAARLASELNVGVLNASRARDWLKKKPDEAKLVIEVLDCGHLDPGWAGSPLHGSHFYDSSAIGPHFYQSHFKRWYPPARLPDLWERWQAEQRFRKLAKKGLAKIEEPLRTPRFEVPLDSTERANILSGVNRKAAQAREAGLDYILVLAPNPMLVFAVARPPEASRFYRDLASDLRAAGTKALDLASCAWSEANPKALYWESDGHWNAAGTQNAASAVAAFIRTGQDPCERILSGLD